LNTTILAGSANAPLADAIAASLGMALGRCQIRRFPDGEMHVQIEDNVRGRDVYLVQPTSPPADTHLVELLLMADACRRAGAARITAVVPYFGYARQDRRSGQSAVGARLAADLIEAAGVGGIVAVDLHAPAIEGFFRVPLQHVSAVPQLASQVQPLLPADSVVVAPDLGAAKLAERYAGLLDLPVAIVHKTRISGSEVEAHGLSGDVRGRAPLIVDDMISTAGTIAAAAGVLLDAGARPEITVAATHALLVGPAKERLQMLPLRHLVVTDTVARAGDAPLPVTVVSVVAGIAGAVRLLRGEDVRAAAPSLL
jgi:ribose-phosphate pyrophosphokinase